MAGEYNASAKFDSGPAERGINSLAGKIDGLKTKLQNVAGAGKQFDSAWAQANRTMTAGAAKARTMETSLANIGKGARSAASAMKGFTGSLNTGEMARSAGIIRSLGTHLSTTAARMRQIRGYATSLTSSLGQMGRQAVAGSLGIERLAKALAVAIPKMMQGASAAKSLAASLGFLQRSYRLNVTGLGQVSTAIRKSNTGMVTQGRTARTTAGHLNSYQHALGSVQNGLLGLGSGLAGVRNLGIAWLTGVGLTGLANMADTAKLTAARLTLVTDGMVQLTTTQNALMESSNRTRSSYKENVNLFTKMAMAGEAYGVSLTKALTISENVQKAFKISGASTSEAQAASQQLAQGFASGRLQGDELRSILENAPRLGKALTEELGIPLSEIRKRAKEGEIGINEMVKAFGSAKVTADLEKEFANMPVTIGEAFTIAGNHLLEFIGKFDKATGASNALVGVIRSVANHFDSIALAAGIAGAALVASYIPALIKTIALSRELIALKWAAYGAGVVGAMSNAAGGIGLFKGALTKSATSTLPMWKQVVGNVTGAAAMNVQNMGSLFRNVFMRLPLIFAVGSVALYAFNDDTKVVEGELATTQDYLVTGFQSAWSAIVSIVEWAGNQISSTITGTIDKTLWMVDQLYRIGKMGVAGAGEALGYVGSLAPGGKTPKQAGKGMWGRIKDAYSGSGLRQDVGNLLKGTQWSKNANDRHNEEWLTNFDKGNKTWQALQMDAGKWSDIGGAPPGGGGGKSDKAGGGSKANKSAQEAKQAAEEAARELKRVREETSRLMATFSEAEQKRQDFNEGLGTLSDALKMGVIDTRQFDDSLRRLANETFPGIRDDLKSLQEENKDLIIKLKGGTDDDVDISHMKAEVDKQIGQIDTIISMQGDVNGTLTAQKQTLREQLATYVQMKGENADLVKLAAQREEAEARILAIVDETWTQMSDLFDATVRQMLDKGTFSFKSFFKGILDMAKGTFVSALNAAVFAPMQEKFKDWMMGALGGKKSATSGIGSAAVGDAQSGATGTYTDLIKNLPPIKIDINGATATPSSSGGVNVEMNGIGGAMGGGENSDDIVVTGTRNKQMGFFPSMVSGYKQSWQDTFKSLGDLFKPVAEIFKKVGAKLGITPETMGKIGEKVGKAFAGAQKGLMVNELLKPLGQMLGFKTSAKGAAIGGAIGSFLPIPGGDIIGAIVGSIIGGLFKKTKKGFASVTTSETGAIQVNSGGSDKAYEKAASALANSVKSGIYQLADQLGGDVAGGMNLGQIKASKGKFSFDPPGMGNRMDFATEQEAIEAMIKYAIKNGIITGLSATSDRVLKTFEDTDRAIQIVTALESIKKQADAIRDPTGALFEDLKNDIEDTLRLFQEAGASQEDYADLALVAQEKFKDVIEATMKQLQDFRDDLTGGSLSYLTPADKLAAASEKFKLMEADIAAGKAVDPSTFTAAASELIGLARDVYGSTPEFAEYQKRVLAATDAMIASQQAVVDAYKPMIDAIVAAAAKASSDAAITNTYLEGIYYNTGGTASPTTGGSSPTGGSAPSSGVGSNFNTASY